MSAIKCTNKKLLAAHSAHRRAGEALAAATAKAFPVGSTITVTLGRAHITGEVLHSGGCWWSSPHNVQIRNLRTGKTRWFNASIFCDARVTEPPRTKHQQPCK